MADVYADLKNWSATASSNLPSGSAAIGTGLDDNLRQIQATVVQDLANVGADIVSATTTDLGAIPGLFHTISGTTTITSFGTVRAGIWKVLTFSGALTITYNATSLITPINADLVTVAGDSFLAESLGSGNWKLHNLRSVRSTPNKLPTITATVGSSALTIGMTTQYLDFRSATLTSGTISSLSCSPSSLVVSSGSTLGTTSAVISRLAVAAINNAGTVELAVANMKDLTLDESNVISTTAEGGAGAADTTGTWYSTTARSNVAFRLIGVIESTQATAGTWATTPSLIQGITSTGAPPPLAIFSNSLSGDVALNNTSNYFDGPTVAQGTKGTWFVSGTITLIDSSTNGTFYAKLWDGTTVIASAVVAELSINFQQTISLSGYITGPTGNLRISARDTVNATGKILFNATGNSKDSTLTALRIG